MSYGQERNEFFQKLKPCCVRISQMAIKGSSEAPLVQELDDLTNQLLSILDYQIQENPLALDEKIAEYAFFPLYHIFRHLDNYPMPLIENCVKCLTVLINHGWKTKLSSKLVQQILNLLTFIIDGVPGSATKREVPEETALESFRSLKSLFNAAGTSITAASGLVEDDNLPALGHSITVILHGAADGANPLIQLEALRTLQAAYTTIREHAALASFLPGTISSLTKITSKPAHHKRNVLAMTLKAVALVLTRVLADLRTRSILSKLEGQEKDDTDGGKLLSPAWLRATAGQVQRALSAMMKLRTHDSVEVREALKKLCVTLLDECHKTLQNCTYFLVETAIMLETSDDSRTAWSDTTLRDLVSIYPELGEAIKVIAYSWMSSLPRIMQGSDEGSKQIAIHNLSKGIELLRSLHIESSTLDDSISGTLRDCVSSLILSAKHEPTKVSTDVRLIDDTNSTVERPGIQFQPILLSLESQKGVRNELMSFIGCLGSASQQASLASGMLDYAHESTSSDQVTALWLCFQLVKASQAGSTDVDAILDLSSMSLDEPTEAIQVVFNDLYSTSVQILSGHTEDGDVDWRLEAIALEVIAYTAQKSGPSFRPELIDVLFPITTCLGTDNQNLRTHAMGTLNTMATACGYTHVSELIVDNVDYMVNSVSLRLNTLEISPTSINVLKMMIRLAGPRLVPYLDDVIESIFASLDNYHGYPMFVESLFMVLKEVVDQGVKSDMLLLESQKSTPVDHRKKETHVDDIQSLLETILKRKQDVAEEEIETTGHPREPWKSRMDKADEGQDDAGTQPQEPEKPPNTPTYQLLLRVADLTQHYLTSPTPTLRRSLLELLTTASVALAHDEDSFLPLVNAIWPVVIDRLRDPEAYIVMEACHALSGLCAAAGDFLTSRFATEWGEWLKEWCRRAKSQSGSSLAQPRPHGAEGREGHPKGRVGQILIPIRGEDGLGGKPSSLVTGNAHSGGLGQYASPFRIWEAVVGLLTSMISYVRVDDSMFDEVLDLLADDLDRNEKVRDALEAINGDAVWLARYERGGVEWLPTPQANGVQFIEMDRPQ